MYLKHNLKSASSGLLRDTWKCKVDIWQAGAIFFWEVKLSLFKAKRKVDDEHRQFQEKWEMDYFLPSSGAMPAASSAKRKLPFWRNITWSSIIQLSIQRKYRKWGRKPMQQWKLVLWWVRWLAKVGKPFIEGQFLEDCMLKVASINLVDIMQELNAVNLKLQGPGQLVTAAFDVITVWLQTDVMESPPVWEETPPFSSMQVRCGGGHSIH